jgi:hypothetical protein
MTATTDAARLVAQDMRDFANCEGNAVFLRRMIYENSAVLTELIAEFDVVPDRDEPTMQRLYYARAVCGTAGECGGHTGMWHLMPEFAVTVDEVCDIIETPPPEPPLEGARAGADTPRVN